MSRFKTRLVITLIMLGAVMIFMGSSDVIDSRKTPTDFAAMSSEGMKVGEIVEGDLTSNLGSFEEMYHTTYGIKTGSSDYVYLVPVGSKYIGLKSITQEQVTELDAQANETIDYLLGSSKIEPRKVHFKGKVVQMGNDEQYYAKDYMKQMGLTDAQITQSLSNFMITSVDFDHGMMFVGIGALCVVGALLILAPQISGITQSIGHNKRMKELNAMPSGGVVRDDFDLNSASSVPSEPIVMRKDPFTEAQEEAQGQTFGMSDDDRSSGQRNPWDKPDDNDDRSEKKESSTGLKLKM